MDQPLSSQLQRQTRGKRLLRIGLVVGAVALLAWGARALLKPSAEMGQFRFATVERGPVESAISATGRVIPAYEELLPAPITARLKQVLLRAGAQVRAGDAILVLDAEYVQLQYEQLKDELDLRKNNVTSLKLTFDKDLRDLELRDQIKDLQVTRLEAQLADAQQLQSVGGAPREEVRQAELALQIARLEKMQLANELAYRQAALTSDKRKLELEVQIQEKKLAELARKLRETTVSAPIEGVLTWVNEDIGKNIAEGEALVRLANLSGFRIGGSVADLYASRVQAGLPVRVRIDDRYLDGEIVSVAPEVVDNSLQFQVRLQDPSAAALRPAMQVELLIVTDRKEDALRVVNGPAFTGARVQDLFVVEGNVARKRAVRVGLNNVHYVELDGPLQPGERIIISDMRAYAHLDQIQLTP
ncbi:MAG: efflux RND transporter periplasmic adaptor subunit [Bacteroidia bacterium]